MGSAIGTPAYMPPEQAAGKLDQLGPASDVYSLGATLYYLLTGQTPYASSGLDIGEILRKVESGEFPRPREGNPHLSEALEAICIKAMAVRPRDRYPTAQQLADDVERYLADEPVTAYAEPVLLRASLDAQTSQGYRRHGQCATSRADQSDCHRHCRQQDKSPVGASVQRGARCKDHGRGERATRRRKGERGAGLRKKRPKSKRIARIRSLSKLGEGFTSHT